MKKVYLVFVADEWLSSDSMTVISVCESKEEVDSIVRQYIESHSMKLVEDDDNTEEVVRDLLDDLFEDNQTQGYSYNFSIDLIEMNTLI